MSDKNTMCDKVEFYYKARSQEFPLHATCLEVKKMIAKIDDIDVNRISLKGKVNTHIVDLNTNDKLLQDCNLKYTFYLSVVKDLGPQIGYRTVLVIEYLGPILIMLFSLIFRLSSLSSTAFLLGILWIMHFAKFPFRNTVVTDGGKNEFEKRY